MSKPKKAGESRNELPLLSWDIAFPLVTNRFFLFDMLKVTSISCLIVFVIISLIFIIQGSMDSLRTFALMIGILFVFFNFLFYLIALIFLNNHCHTSFIITKKGISWKMTDKRAKNANRIVTIIGILARKPGIAGSGMLASAGEEGFISWKEIKKIRYYEKQRVISVKNNWRTVIRLYCTTKNFQKVKDIFKSYNKIN
jgi:hypothetical protein